MGKSIYLYYKWLVLSFLLSACLYAHPQDSLSIQHPQLTIGHITPADTLRVWLENRAFMESAMAEAKGIKSSPISDIPSFEVTHEKVMAAALLDDVYPATPTDTLYTGLRQYYEIPYTQSVSPSGAFTVTIPIECYPGIGDAQPHITLSYNSQQGNGPLGMGWSIGGLSQITAGNKNYYYDNEAKSMQSGTTGLLSDVYSLDGVRLLYTGNEYVTATGNTKVTRSVPSGASYISSFRAYLADGSQAWYSVSGVKRYLISTYTDKNGNTVSYTYTGFPEPHISKITYNEGKATIEFEYDENRMDSFISYRNGTKVTENRLLRAIRCKLDGVIQRYYYLGYDTSKYASVLRSLSCRSMNSTSGWLYFNYGSGQSPSGFNASTAQGTEWYVFSNPEDIVTLRGKSGYKYGTEDDALVHYPFSYPFYCEQFYTADRYVNLYSSTEKIYIYGGLVPGSGQFADTMPSLTVGSGFVQLLFADVSPIPGEEIVRVNSVVESGRDILYFTVWSWNAPSGLSQLYQRRFDMGEALSNIYNVYSPWPRRFYTADINGDGRYEILSVSKNEPLGITTKKTRCVTFDLAGNSIIHNDQSFGYDMATGGTNSPSNPDRLYVLDINADGKTDIMLVNSTGLHIYEFGTTYLNNTKNIVTMFTKGDMSSGDELEWGDYNGDGYPDFIKRFSTNWQGLYFGKGDLTFEKSSVTVPNVGNTSRGFIAQDVNGDACTDLIQYDNTSTSNTTFYVHLWTPQNTFSSYGSMTLTGHGALMPIDVSAMEYYSRIAYLRNGQVTAYWLKQNHALERMVSGINRGADPMLTVKYAQLTGASSVYTPGYVSQNDFPYTTFQGNLFVTCNLKQVWRGKTVSNVGYTYENAVIHRQGLGFTGFVQAYSRDSISSHWSRTTLNPLNYGVPVKTESDMALTNYTYNVTVESNKKLHARLTNLSEKDKLKNVTVTTASTFDTWDYPLTQNVTYGTNAVMTRTVTNVYQHFNTQDRYQLGLPTSVTVSDKRGTLAAWTEKSQLTYDEKGNVTEKKVLNGTSHRSTERYTYNTKGQVLTDSLWEYSSTRVIRDKYAYDAYGRVTRHTIPTGAYTNYIYNSETGLLASEADHKGNATVYLRDAWGRILRTTGPDGSETVSKTERVDASNMPNIRFKVTERGNAIPTVTTYYDGLDRDTLQATVRFDGRIVKVNKEYDNRGRLSRVSLPRVGTLNYWDTYTYDSYDRIKKISRAGGNVTDYSYSGLSVTEVSDSVSVKRTYDATGALVSVIDPAGTITYTLRSDGQPSSIKAPGNVTTTLTYDAFGRRTKITDPSAGERTFTYSANGDVSKETDATGKSVNYTYDKYHRLTKQVDAEGVTTNFTYNVNGQPLTEVSSNGVSKRRIYDRMFRDSIWRDTVPDGLFLERRYTYKSTGALNTVKYTVNSGVVGTETHIYTNGWHTRTNWSGSGGPIYLLKAETGRGYVSQIQTGTVTRNYSYLYTYQTGRKATSSSGNTLLNWSYTIDRKKNNVSSRRDSLNNKVETFKYDNLNRLVKYGSRTVSYDVKGNILSKTDAGAYQYTSSAKPYAITQLVPGTNSVPLRNQTVTYGSQMRPLTISENGYVATLTYDASGDRVKEEVTRNGSAYMTKHYIGGVYERKVSTSSTAECLYLGGDYYSAPMVAVKTGTGSWTLYNILRDPQGSILKVTNSSGSTVKGEYSYDAWGRMRNPSTWSLYAADNQPSLYLDRGYTGHEHLRMFGIINMNARLYDPVLGRFFSPDPFVQAGDLSQSYNRYGYCMNNPMKYVDESGESILGIILIAGLIGGTSNLIYKAIEGKINSVGNAFVAFGVGAVAGGIGAFAGTSSFVLAGGSLLAPGAGGFVAGAVGGGVGSFTSSVLLSISNNIAFGDPLFSFKGLLTSTFFGALTGGVINGVTAALNHHNFWSGNAVASGRNVFSFNNTPLENGGINASSSGQMEIKPNLSPQSSATTSSSSEVSSVKMSPYEKGQQGVNRAMEEVKAKGGTILDTEVSFKVDDIRFRIDVVGKINNKMSLFEIKNGPSSHFTTNQKIVYPKMLFNKVPVLPVGNKINFIQGLNKNVFLKDYDFYIIRYY